MKYIFALVLAVGLAAGVLLGVTQQTPTAEASYYLMDCGDNDHVRWTGNMGRADVYHGGFPTWWRNETIRGAAIWDVSTVGADFDFIMDSSSSHDWKKQTLNSLSEIGITVLAANASTCRLTSVDTWFNTKYNFAICSNCNHKTYDVRTVAGHEFGHWLVLEDYPWYDFWSDGQCLMRDWHGTDHTLCNDDVEGIIELYGED